MKKFLVSASIIVLILAFSLPAQAAEWDWVKSANTVNLSGTNHGMLFVPMNSNDEFIFYIAPADYVGQNTVAECSVTYYEDPTKPLARGNLSTAQSNYISWRSDEHHLAVLTCSHSSGNDGNIHMVAGDNAILHFPEYEPIPEPENCCPKSSRALLYGYCPDTQPCLTENPTIQVYSFNRNWYLKILIQWTGLLWINVPEQSISCCPDSAQWGIDPELCPMNACYAQYLGPTQYQLWSDGESWYVHDAIELRNYRIYLK
jgi:hypothetical protein